MTTEKKTRVGLWLTFVYIVVLGPLLSRVLPFFWTEPVGNCLEPRGSGIWFQATTLSGLIVSAILLGFLVPRIFQYGERTLQIASFCFLATAFLSAIFGFAFLYLRTGLQIESLSGRADYLYFSVTTLTTLGYGDVQPCPEFRLLTSIQAMIGFLFFPVMIASFLELFRNSYRDLEGGQANE